MPRVRSGTRTCECVDVFKRTVPRQTAAPRLTGYLNIVKWILAVTVLLLTCSGSSAAGTGFPVAEYPNYHAAGGRLQGSIRSEALCKIRCGQTEWCAALDFDFTTLTCWFHGIKTACRRLIVLPRANHYKYIDCSPPVRQKLSSVALAALKDVAEQYRNAQSSGGTRVPGPVTWIDCVLTCTGRCLAVDFDSVDNSCWHHYGSRACHGPDTRRVGSYHFRMARCSDRSRRQAHSVVSRINHLQAKPVVARNSLLPAPVLTAPGVATCGRPVIPPTGSRIIGGDESRPHSWPWQVALRNINARSSRCAGTLIAPQWVLTTAHCVDQDQTPANWFVLAGAHDLLQLESTRAVHAVSRIIIHEHFDLSTFNNDIALLRLTVPVQFNAHISPVCLPPPNTVLPPGTRCVIIGWGVAANGRRPLKQATVPVVSLSTCRRPDWLGLEFTLTENMMCAGYETGGIDTCQGDSGGPLVCYINNVWMQAGVTSFGRGCGMPRKPGVYTMVSRFVKWIQTTVNTF